jgi:hypothetical protein
VVLAVNLGEEEKEVRSYARTVGLSFPVLLDWDYQVGRIYGVRSHPMRFLIDREGRALAVGIGFRDWSSREAQSLITMLLEPEAKEKERRESFRP